MNQPQSRQNGAIDGQIDQALAHLDSVQPPAGLNDRLRQRFEIHAADTDSSNRSFPTLNRARRPFWALGLTGAAVAALVAALSFGPARTKPQPQPAKSHAALADRPETGTPIPSSSPIGTGRQAPIPYLRTSSHATEIHPVPIPASGTDTPPLSPEEAKALDDLHAPSQPSPPLPVTAQEKAILHLLRRDGTVELAQLDPVVQTKQFELQRAGLQQFFDPPPPPSPLKPEGETK